MTNRILFLVLSSFLLTGCFAESLTLIKSGVGASQGRALQSSISPVISFSIKQTTGKFPVEHIIREQTQRIVKKTSDFEKKVINGAKKTIKASKGKVSPVIRSVDNQVTMLNDNLLKIKTFTIKNFKHKPRFSYKVR